MFSPHLLGRSVRGFGVLRRIRREAAWFLGPIESTRWRFRRGARWRAALVLDGTDLVLLSLRAAGCSPMAECARDRPAAAPPCDFPAFVAAGRRGFGGPSRWKRKLPLEGSREGAPLLLAGVRRLILCMLVVDRG